MTNSIGNARIILGQAIGNAYMSGLNDASAPETVCCYAAMNREIGAQYDALVADGWTFQPWEQTGQPYPETDSAPLLADMARKHLWFFKSEAGQEPHALMSLADNDRFRCVHDVLGHGAGGYSFSHAGE